MEVVVNTMSKLRDEEVFFEVGGKLQPSTDIDRRTKDDRRRNGDRRMNEDRRQNDRRENNGREDK